MKKHSIKCHFNIFRLKGDSHNVKKKYKEYNRHSKCANSTIINYMTKHVQKKKIRIKSNLYLSFDIMFSNVFIIIRLFLFAIVYNVVYVPLFPMKFTYCLLYAQVSRCIL